jgi:hypothetical protein
VQRRAAGEVLGKQKGLPSGRPCVQELLPRLLPILDRSSPQRLQLQLHSSI